MNDNIQSALADAGSMLELAQWAARDFATYDRTRVLRIAEQVAKVAAEHAQRLAEDTVRETGFGVVAHKTIKNVASSVGFMERFGEQDFISSRMSHENLVEIPRPAGVVLAVAPTTNPVSTLFAKTMACLLTRNAIVVCPHPGAEKVSIAAAELLARAAEEAGAPVGVIQIVPRPQVDVVTALMSDQRVNVIVATGGGAMVHAAYSSGRPAIGVGPGNAPVVVGRSADVAKAAAAIVESKTFDNSLLCTNESVLLYDEAIAAELEKAMVGLGAVVLDDDDTARLREFMFDSKGTLNRSAIGRPAGEIAKLAGLSAGHEAVLLIAEVEQIVDEEYLIHEKLSPVLAARGFRTQDEGVAAATNVLRIVGAGHSAAIHSQDTDEIFRYAVALPTLRLAVNGGNSMVSSGLNSGLPLTMTVGTGFLGGSSLDGNFEPKHLVHWTRITGPTTAPIRGTEFAGRDPWPATVRQVVRSAPCPSSIVGLASSSESTLKTGVSDLDEEHIRAELRRLLAEEFSLMGSEIP